MNHRTFGRSGIEISEIVFGGGGVGGILIHQDDATKREAIRRALAGGINWIDTAAMYGNGKSEEALGWLLPEAGATPYLSPSSVSTSSIWKTSRHRSRRVWRQASRGSSVHRSICCSCTTASDRSPAAG
jgi:predicted aldo/keto reductase-like oxidoreductase